MRTVWRCTRRWMAPGGLLLTCLLLLAPVPSRAAEPDDVVRATLPNGLRVVLVRNRLAPVVTTAVNYLVGADQTPAGFPGMAHALEHMMFRGGPGLSAEQLADIGSVMGGRFNADTRQTVTQYFFTVPSEDLDVALHIEAARMQSVFTRDEDWAQERGAIEQEVAADLSSPRYILYTKLRQALYPDSSYAHDALGSKPTFDKTTGAMLKKFHDDWYAPNNAVLIVAGDLDPQKTLATVTDLFGGIARKQLPTRPAVRLKPVKPQTVRFESNLPYTLAVLAFRMPGLESPDYPAAEVLADVLQSKRAALYALVPQGKALSVDFSVDPMPKSALAQVSIALPAGADPKSVQAEAKAILGRIAKDGVAPDLVSAAKTQERRAAEFEKNSIEGLATVWSEAVAVYGLDSPDTDLARIEKVTVADVNRIAKKYLQLDQAVTAVLTPQPENKRVASAGGFGGQEAISLGEAKPTDLPDWAQSALGHLTVPEQTSHPVVSTLANGITLIVQPESVSDTISIYGRVRNRPELQVPQGQEGLSQVLDELFSYGSETLDRLQFQAALDAIGAEAKAGTQFGVEALAENFDRATALLADNELHPAFPAAAFEVVKRQAAASVAGRLKSPSYQSSRSLRSALYPPADPIQREALPETISKLSLQDVKDYHRAAFRPDLTVITVIGKVTPEQAKAVIEKHFGSWRADGDKPETLLPPAPLNKPGSASVADASRVQDRVTLAETLGINRSSPDYYALELGNSVLGGAFYATRLTRDIRRDAGLVYSISADFSMSQTRGVYFIEYACDPENVSRVEAMVGRELLDMQNQPVTDGELQRAKALLLRQIPLGESSIGAVAQGMIRRWALDLPLDEPIVAAKRYLDIGAPDIQAAFGKWIRPGDFVRVTQGPAPR